MIFPSKSICENLIIEKSNIIQKGTFFNKNAERKTAEEAARKFNIRGYSSLDKAITNLSGGNMQKVLLARIMIIEPRLLMLLEPTQGIDVGAKEEIKQLVLNAAREGKGVLLATSEIDDIIGLCNRVSVIKDGKIRATMDATEDNKQRILEVSSQ